MSSAKVSSLPPVVFISISQLGCINYARNKELCVTSTVFDSLNMSFLQLAQFRSLLANAEGEAAVPILHNHRLPQPLKGRTVRASF